jgi:uncharacterized RDD family membrane protein YckC
MAEETLSPFSPPRSDLEGGLASRGNQSLAQRGSRFVAVLLDGLVALPVMALLGIGSFVSASARTAGSDPGTSVAILSGIGGLLALAMGVFQIYLLSTTGQTLGKRWMKIRIVKLDGSNPGFVGAVLLRAVVSGLLGVIPFYSLVDLLFIFSEDQRCLHDKIAGTRVVVA